MYVSLQVVAGLRYKLRFDMRKSICAKADHKELNVLCVPDEENVVNMDTKLAPSPSCFPGLLELMYVCVYLCVCRSSVTVTLQWT